MTLFGALSSGVSGLTAQSSAIGAISDNITNLSTVGYKATQVDFQTLVTTQTSATFFSAGGVQSRPRQDTGIQGLLAASTSQTDIAISGNGFFVVNEAAVPGISDEYLFTRAGSFFQDNNGFLRNTSGFFLQAWPTDPSGTVIPSNRNISISNQNVISRDFLETVNLNRVGGTASATSNIAIGANLPSNDSAGTERKTDVQFFDSLGNPTAVSIINVKTTVDNNWDLNIEPPPGTAVITLEDKTSPIPLVYDSIGQLEFLARPSEGSRVTIDGITYEVDATVPNVTETATLKRWDTTGNSSIGDDVADLVAAISTKDSDFEAAGGRVVIKTGDISTILFRANGNDDIIIDPTFLLDANGVNATNQTSSFTVNQQAAIYTDETQLRFPVAPADTETITINGITYTFLTAEATTDGDTDIRIDTLPNMLADLVASIIANDPEFTSANVRARATNLESTGGITNNTLSLKSKANGTTFTIVTSAITANAPTHVLKTPTAFVSGTTVETVYAVIFNSDGIPSAFNVDTLDIRDFSNGASNMDGTATGVSKITLNLGTIKEANGLTQFGGSFTPVFITQNGSQFGTFAGVTITEDGLVTALFDNGETRPVFQIPISTFVNTNQLGSRSGNVWNATEASGDPTLRIAASGSAGIINQTTLEQSTVDIGTEFTKMIVVQRAFSAASKIITTADEMLEELLRTKR